MAGKPGKERSSVLRRAPELNYTEGNFWSAGNTKPVGSKAILQHLPDVLPSFSTKIVYLTQLIICINISP